MSSYSIYDDFISTFSSSIDATNLSRFKYFTDKTSSSLGYIVNYVVFYLAKVETLGVKRIFFVPNTSLEALVFTFFLIFSEHEVYILPSDFSSHSPLYRKLNTKSFFDNSVICTFSGNNSIPNIDIPLLIFDSLEDFSVLTHPSRDCRNQFLALFEKNSPGITVFTSSGSSGEPKLIPLTIQSIDQCYQNCISGLFNKITFSDICCVHSPSFVIVLPFLFLLVLV